MSRVFAAAFLAFLIIPLARAQKGEAESGYWPLGYNGTTWTGQVTAVNDGTREITLTYTNKKGDKTETFIGVLKAGLDARMADGSSREIKPSDFPIGTRITVYYMTDIKKVNGKKVETNTIFKFKTAPPSK